MVYYPVKSSHYFLSEVDIYVTWDQSDTVLTHADPKTHRFQKEDDRSLKKTSSNQ